MAYTPSVDELQCHQYGPSRMKKSLGAILKCAWIHLVFLVLMLSLPLGVSPQAAQNTKYRRVEAMAKYPLLPKARGLD